ncbi:MAG: signal peptide peptidase SppA, partial [Myxococcales bacterium]|nr:signal peptide peptidase SppA [Myxococcales bacterium]
MTSMLFLAALAHGQPFPTHHPPVPSAGIASENGPGTLWVNPANLAYDPDFRYALFMTELPANEPIAGSLGPTSVAATVGIGGASLGLSNLLRPDGEGGARSDWTAGYATSIALPERIAFGLALNWTFADGEDPNYLAYDAGLSWRPLPWFGVSGVAQNVGSPDPLGLAVPKSGAGIALRPFGRAAVLGLDYAHYFYAQPGVSGADEDHLSAVLRLRPVEGLYLRANTEALADLDGITPLSVGLGLEVYLDGFGVLVHGSHDLVDLVGETVMVGSDEPGESLIRDGRRVPALELDQAPPYQRGRGLFSESGPTWLDVLERLRRSEDDDEVRGIAIELDGVGLSSARARELRERIVAFEAAGKPVLVYLTGAPGNLDVYVASAASRIVLHPAADVDLTGLSVELQHLRGLLDKVGVQPQYVKRAEYKSAPESFTETEPTPANLEMTNALVDDLFAELVRSIAQGRHVDETEVRGWIDAGPHDADHALEIGLVDELAYPDEVERKLSDLHGQQVHPEDLLQQPQPHSPWEDPQQIAVIYVEGGIVSGRSSPGGLFSGRTTGSDSVVKALARARQDQQIRAVVLRVDSPGGSSFASDEIWRAVERVQEKGKPVVVSMGGVAASGGYYVSAGADAIWAEPNTITGSIGVFSGKFATRELQERLGVNTVSVTRGRNADLYSGTRPWDDVQRAKMQSLVDHTYEQFKSRVAEGRHLTPEEVERIARGRVWSGEDAKEVKLVDELGGMQDAIADARKRAGIPARRKVGLV